MPQAAPQHAHHPDFFAQVAPITLRDPLAGFLGAAQDGIMEYHYVDAVRLAGHSCPTVAGSWLMVTRGLHALYGDDLPVRGEIEVFLADSRDNGATGVVATVAQLITGAANEMGFHGIGPRFSRKDLLNFDAPLHGTLGLRRLDTGRAVQVTLDASLVPWPDEMRAIMPKCVTGQATPDELTRFGVLWQNRVRQMLIEHANDDQMVQVSEWHTA